MRLEFLCPSPLTAYADGSVSCWAQDQI